MTDAPTNTTAPMMPPAESMAAQAIARLIADGYSSSLMKLSRPTLNELGRRLVQPGVQIDRDCVEWLDAEGHDLARSSVYRWAQRFREVYKATWAEWANKLVVAQLSTDPQFDVERLQGLIKNRVTTLIAQEVMTSEPHELKTDRINAALTLLISADKGRLERDKLALATKQAEDRAAKLEAEVQKLQLENDRRRRELQASIDAAKKTVQTQVEGGSKSIDADDVIAILDRVMKGEAA